MKTARFLSIYLLLSCSLLFAQSGLLGAKKHSSGPSQRGTKQPSYNQCDSLSPVIMADGSSLEDYVAAGDWAIYAVYLKAGHSYALEVSNPFGQDNTHVNGRPALYFADGSCSIAASTDVSSVDPALNTGFSGRIARTPSTDGFAYVALLNTDGVDGYYFNVRLVDTTLSSPRWSTYSGFLTQWGFNNVTNSSISGVFTIRDTTGTAIKTVNVTVPAGKVKFYSSIPADLNLPTNTSGSVMFSYIGPAGAIEADATILNSSVTVITPVKFEPRNFQH